MSWNKDRKKHALTQDGLFSMYLQMETKWKAKKKNPKNLAFKMFYLFLYPLKDVILSYLLIMKKIF